MAEREEPGGPGQALHWRAARERGKAESQPLTVQDLAPSRVPACKRARTTFPSRRVRSPDRWRERWPASATGRRGSDHVSRRARSSWHENRAQGLGPGLNVRSGGPGRGPSGRTWAGGPFWTMRRERGLLSLAAPATCPDCAPSTYRSVSFARWFSSLPCDGRCELSQLLRWVGRGIGLDFLTEMVPGSGR